MADSDKQVAPTGSGATLDLQGLEKGLLQHVTDLGLPVDKILVPVTHRANVISGVGLALEPLSAEQRSTAVYLSKFMAAVAAGLFDAALNYLWDETVGELRRRVAAYDLGYFFDLAVGPASDRRKRLSTADDLSKVEDQELILASNQIGLLSDAGRQQLDLVRYMRNHASAAHPNQVELRALQLLGYLEACIAEVMVLQPDDVVIEIKKLLANIKSGKLAHADAQAMASTFDNMPAEQADNLGNGLFGIYTRVTSENQTRDNIRLLLPELWPYLGEETRRQFGVKAARYTVNHQQEEARLARELLDTVDAASYLPDELRTPEVDAALDALMVAHQGWNNFSNEGPPARHLAQLVGTPPDVPKAIRQKYVKTITYVFLTNGSGESWSANPVYTDLIKNFSTAEARIALGLFRDRDVANRLHQPRSELKFRALLDLLDSKIVSNVRREIMSALKALPEGEMHTANHNRNIRQLIEEARRASAASNRSS